MRRSEEGTLRVEEEGRPLQAFKLRVMTKKAGRCVVGGAGGSVGKRPQLGDRRRARPRPGQAARGSGGRRLLKKEYFFNLKYCKSNTCLR